MKLNNLQSTNEDDNLIATITTTTTKANLWIQIVFLIQSDIMDFIIANMNIRLDEDQS